MTDTSGAISNSLMEKISMLRCFAIFLKKICDEGSHADVDLALVMGMKVTMFVGNLLVLRLPWTLQKHLGVAMGTKPYFQF